MRRLCEIFRRTMSFALKCRGIGIVDKHRFVNVTFGQMVRGGKSASYCHRIQADQLKVIVCFTVESQLCRHTVTSGSPFSANMKRHRKLLSFPESSSSLSTSIYPNCMRDFLRICSGLSNGSKGRTLNREENVRITALVSIVSQCLQVTFRGA